MVEMSGIDSAERCVRCTRRVPVLLPRYTASESKLFLGTGEKRQLFRWRNFVPLKY